MKEPVIQQVLFDILKGEGVELNKEGTIYALMPFMERNGFSDGRGWWMRK